MKKSLSTLVMLPAVLVSSAYAKEKIVYGVDNRVEVYEATQQEQELAKSTAGMIQNEKLIELKDGFMLPPSTISSDMGLCHSERFSSQPSAVICSGFLVAPDLLVTAGHCIETQDDCNKMSWVFDYKVKKESGRADIIVPKKNVYKCKEVLEAKLEGDQDYALIRLDREAVDRKGLSYRYTGKVKDKAFITVIGHPSGLPSKVASGANVLVNSNKNFFMANLDTFGGNSGSAVFNSITGEVEGILVRGAKDYVDSEDNSCLMVNDIEATEEEIIQASNLKESVSRITDIKTLKYRFLFFNAVKSGNLEKVKEIFEKIEYKNIYDDKRNNALHMAIDANHNHIASFLIENGIEVNAKNNLGETAAHRCGYRNNSVIAHKLIEHGADFLVKDNQGLLPSQKTHFLAFKTRMLLKNFQNVQFYKRRR